MEPDSITHYGVKGMKWGVRRTQAQLDRSAGRRAQKKDAKRARKTSNAQNSKSAKRAEAKTLSNDELRSRINRLQMEKQYSELASSPAVKSGAQKVGGLMLQEGAKIVSNAGKQVVTQVVKNEMEKAFGLR